MIINKKRSRKKKIMKEKWMKMFKEKNRRKK